MPFKPGFLEVACLIHIIFFIGCGTEVKKKKRISTHNLEKDVGSSDDLKKASTNTKLTSTEAYEKTLYPLLAENCGSCHSSTVSPLFASDEIDGAYEAIVAGNKVDFEDIENSRVVARLAEDQHNCWSGDCAADADEVASLIQEWSKLVENVSEKAPIAFTSEPLSLNDATESEGEKPTDTYVWEAESFSSIEAPMTVVSAAGASGGSVIEVPPGNGGRIVDLTVNNVGFVTYQVQINEAGTYKLWSRMQTPNNQSDSAFFSINGSPFTYWTSNIASPDFQWVEAATGNNRLEYSIELEEGIQEIRIRRREENAKFDMFALTKDLSFNGGDSNLSQGNSTLTFDLSEVLGDGAQIKVDVSKYDDFSLVFKNPEIILPQGKAHLKSLYFLINDKKNPQAATFSIIDEEVSAPGKVLSGASLIQPFDLDALQDKIKIQFEILELK